MNPKHSAILKAHAARSAEMIAHVHEWKRQHGTPPPMSVIASLARGIGAGMGAEYQFVLVAIGLKAARS